MIDNPKGIERILMDAGSVRLIHRKIEETYWYEFNPNQIFEVKRIVVPEYSSQHYFTVSQIRNIQGSGPTPPLVYDDFNGVIDYMSKLTTSVWYTTGHN